MRSRPSSKTRSPKNVAQYWRMQSTGRCKERRLYTREHIGTCSNEGFVRDVPRGSYRGEKGGGEGEAKAPSHGTNVRPSTQHGVFWGDDTCLVGGEQLGAGNLLVVDEYTPAPQHSCRRKRK